MSSFKNAAKSWQKTHREISQPEARKHLGILEKKKDYKERADDYQRKQNTLKSLKRKALDRNPDEFYFNMVKTKLEDGEHQQRTTVKTYTDDQLKLMQTQDIKYLVYKRTVELKKIEKLKSNLHLLDSADKPKNSHIVFVDSKQEAQDFDPVEYLQTDPELLDRTYNRPTVEQLKNRKIAGATDEMSLMEMAGERTRLYKELSRRIEREKQLSITIEKMQLKNNSWRNHRGQKRVTSLSSRQQSTDGFLAGNVDTRCRVKDYPRLHRIVAIAGMNVVTE